MRDRLPRLDRLEMTQTVALQWVGLRLVRAFVSGLVATIVIAIGGLAAQLVSADWVCIGPFEDEPTHRLWGKAVAPLGWSYVVSCQAGFGGSLGGFLASGTEAEGSLVKAVPTRLLGEWQLLSGGDSRHFAYGVDDRLSLEDLYQCRVAIGWPFAFLTARVWRCCDRSRDEMTWCVDGGLLLSQGAALPDPLQRQPLPGVVPTRIRFCAAIANVVCLGIGLEMVVEMLGVARGAYRVRRGCCPQCGYRTALGVCSECGDRTGLSAHRGARHQRSVSARRAKTGPAEHRRSSPPPVRDVALRTLRPPRALERAC